VENRGSGDRQAILDAALAEVVAKGIDESTVEGVAPIRPDYIVQMLDIVVRGVRKNPAS